MGEGGQAPKGRHIRHMVTSLISAGEIAHTPKVLVLQSKGALKVP